MPAQRAGITPIAIQRFDVVGLDADKHPCFVRHVALAAEGRTHFTAPADLPVRHMRPPLENRGECQPSCVGSAGLTIVEQNRIQVFADELHLEYEASCARPRRQYVIAPHVAEIRSEDQTVIGRRFSCVGFIIEAYREARIDLLHTAEEDLPLVTLDTLKTQYPDQARILDREQMRLELGIPGAGPWPVVLAGYALNALARDEEEIRATPYRATAEDAFFPPRRASD